MSRLYSYRDNDLYIHHSLDPTPNPADFPMHAHESFEIFYFISGQGSYLVEGSVYPLTPGDILILRYAETHTLYISPDTPYERMAIHFPKELIDVFDSRLLTPFTERMLGHHNLYHTTDHPELKMAFETLHFSDSGLQRDHILARLYLFLSELYDVYASSPHEHSSSTDHSDLLRFVNEHLFEELSIDTISDHFGKSPSQISRDFKNLTGSNLWSYIKTKRLLAARALILRGTSAMKAAADCGFTDYSAFYRGYRKRFLHAPSDEAKKSSSVF